MGGSGIALRADTAGPSPLCWRLLPPPEAWMPLHTLLIFPVMSPGPVLLALATKAPGLAPKPGRVSSQGELQAGNSPDESSPPPPAQSPRPGAPREESGGEPVHEGRQPVHR